MTESRVGKAGPGCDRRAVSVQLGTAPALQGAVNTRSDVLGSSGEVQPYQARTVAPAARVRRSAGDRGAVLQCTFS